MPLDTGVFSRAQGFEDYQRAEQEFQLKKQLAAAQIAKYQELDADKLGEQAFLKASQGLPLSGQETAALRYIDAKSPTSAFNPVTGNMEVKPSLLDRAGLNASSRPAPAGGGGFPSPQPGRNVPAPVALFDASGTPVNDAPAEQPNEWDLAFQKELSDARGNPRLQQDIRSAYAKKKLDMNAEESKAATYADRFQLAEPVLTDEAKIAAYSSPWQSAIDVINPFGDQLNSDDYRSYNQARKNATTAKLRQESGATINPSEFKTDDETLYPQINDSPELIAQKKANRDIIAGGLKRQAGPAYKPAVIKAPEKALKLGDTKTSPTGTYMFNGGDPADKSNWKKVK